MSKSSVYRQLEILVSENILKEVDFQDGHKRYEFSDSLFEHHHHLICKNCKKVSRVEIASMERELNKIEKQLENKIYLRKKFIIHWNSSVFAKAVL